MARNRMPICDLSVNSNTVTPSCTLLTFKFPNGKKNSLIVDCGIAQEQTTDLILANSFPFNLKEIEGVIATHNHVDHTGRLPLLVKNGYTKKIFCTNDTAKLLPLALNDSCRVLGSIAKNTLRRKPYAECDVQHTLGRLVPCDFQKEIKITDNIKVTFFMNGHLPGAALTLIQVSYLGCDDMNYLFSGDYKANNMFFNVQELPEWVLNLPLTIVMESTYGNMDSTDITYVFHDNVRKCIASRGTAVIPVFSLGRAQEIMYTLKCMQEDGSIPYEIPIYFDGGLAHSYTYRYLRGDICIKEEMRDFMPKNVRWVSRLERMFIAKNTDCKIILTSSGMGTYGPAQVYIPEYISRPGSLIQFTGYTAEGTLGNKLKYAEKGMPVAIGSLIKPKLADVEYTTEFSAHAKADEIIKFLQKFNNIKLLLLHHGEPEVKEAFAKRLLKEVKAKDIGILESSHIIRTNAYGLCKMVNKEYISE